MSIWKQRKEFMKGIDMETLEYISNLPLKANNLQELEEYKRELEKRLKDTPYIPVVIKCNHVTSDNCNLWQTIQVCFPQLYSRPYLYLMDVHVKKDYGWEHGHLLIFKV
jgi:hypothetical protein